MYSRKLGPLTLQSIRLETLTAKLWTRCLRDRRMWWLRKDGAVCGVCQKETNVGDEGRMLKYVHKFHSNCIVNWHRSKATCPLCRYQVQFKEFELKIWGLIKERKRFENEWVLHFFFLFTFCNIQFMYYNSLFIIDFCFNYVPLTMISHLYIYIYIYCKGWFWFQSPKDEWIKV